MGFKYSIPTDGAKLLMLFFGEGQLRDRGEAVVKLRTPVWCRPKALRCLVTVKVGGLHKVLMWDFVQVAVMMTRVSCV
ncbi:unnamed protein product [Prunus armeniaca]